MQKLLKLLKKLKRKNEINNVTIEIQNKNKQISKIIIQINRSISIKVRRVIILQIILIQNRFT